MASRHKLVGSGIGAVGVGTFVALPYVFALLVGNDRLRRGFLPIARFSLELQFRSSHRGSRRGVHHDIAACILRDILRDDRNVTYII